MSSESETSCQATFYDPETQIFIFYLFAMLLENSVKHSFSSVVDSDSCGGGYSPLSVIHCRPPQEMASRAELNSVHREVENVTISSDQVSLV